MSPKLTDPVPLRQVMEGLLKKKATQSLTMDEREALAECGFRLAVDRSTPVSEAVRLLRRGLRLDGANPRYAYHLARLYFLHGDLDQAAIWLQRAIAQCPTSHRIWTHVSLLQRELYARYHGDMRYGVEELRDRGDKITRAIRDGQDVFAGTLGDFTPPPSEKAREEEQLRLEKQRMEDPFAERQEVAEAARLDTPGNPPTTPPGTPEPPPRRRFTDPGKCRWSGIDDLTIEGMLEAQPASKLDSLLPLLEQVAQASATRPRGVSGFVILAIQWLVSGYPVGTIRRLWEKLPTDPRPELDLLASVCELFEVAEEELPRRLAEAVHTGKLPPFLTALIHQRRLLWYPLHFSRMSDYRAARRFLNTARRSPPKDEAGNIAQDKEIADHVKDLRRAVKGLYPTPPRRLTDRVAREATVTATTATRSPEERLYDLEAQASELTKRLDGAWPRLLELERAHKEGSLEENGLAGLRAVAIDVGVAKNASSTGLKEMADLRASGQLSGPEQLAKVDQIERLFKSIASRPGKFQKILNKLPVPRIDATELAVATIPTAPSSASLSPDAGRATRENLSTLETQAGEMKLRLDRDWARLVVLEKAHKSGAIDAAEQAELQAIAENVEAAKAACSEALKEMTELRNGGDLSAEQVNQIEKIERGFKDNATRPGKFQKILGKLPIQKPPTDPVPFASPPTGREPGQQAAAATDSLASSVPVRQPRIGDDSLKGLASLEKALDDTDRELIQFFNTAGATLKWYSRRSLRSPALHQLRGLIRSRAAEVFFRLGRRQLARRLWNSLLCMDRLDAHLLRNLAVCDTRDPDASRCLSSWRSYAEMLYFYDIVEGSPRPHAAARAEFHREFSHAYAPAFLQAKPEAAGDEKANEAAFAAFLDSPGRLRHFVGHKLLEFLNGKLDFRSPLWVLGVRKSDGPKARARARDALFAFVEATCPLLPARIRDGFRLLCLAHIESSAKACGTPNRLTPDKDPHYVSEESRHVQWLKEVVRFKKTLYIHVQNNEALSRHLKNLDFLDEFARFDSVPIDQSTDLLNAAALANGLQDGEVVLDLMGGLTDHVLWPMLQFVFSDRDVGTEETLRQTQYQRLVGTWSTSPALNQPRKVIHGSSYLELIDDPFAFYPPEIIGALKGAATPRSVDLLREWVGRYPRSTGPARHLANLLSFGEQYKRAIDLGNADDPAAIPLLLNLIDSGVNPEALEVLERASQVGVTEKGRQECQKLRSQLLGQMLPMVQNTLVLFVNLSEKKKLDVRRLTQTVNRWVNGAREQMNGWDSSSGEPPFSQAQLAEVEKLLDEVVVRVGINALGDLAANWRGVLNFANRHLEETPGSLSALFYRMLAWHGLAVEASKGNNRTEILRCLRESRRDAQQVLREAQQEHYRQQAQQLLDEIAKIPGV